MIHYSSIEKWLFYEEANADHMRSFGMLILRTSRQMELYLTKGNINPKRIYRGTPDTDDLKKWHKTGIIHEDFLLLEELLLLLRLPLAVPEAAILDGIHHRLEIGSGDQLLHLEWAGTPAPLYWRPLDELTKFLRDFRIRASKPGYFRPSPLEGE